MRLPPLLLLLATAMAMIPTQARSEEPVYAVLESLDAGAEVRDYAPKLVAEVRVQAKDFAEAGSAGFRPLADFIFGNNVRQERIGMTSPVTQSAVDGGWVVGFVMPARYSPETLPRPNDPRVRVVALPRRTLAAIRFSGRWSNVRYAEHWRLLQRELDKAGWIATGEPMAAQYDAPWVPGPLRRNEILVAVQRRP